MRRARPRLVALVCLAAYLLANTHAGAVLAALCRTAATPAAPKQQGAAEPDHDDESPPCCKHCAKHRHQAPDETPPDSPAPQDDRPAPPCPCCPDGPSDPTCPCP